MPHTASGKEAPAKARPFLREAAVFSLLYLIFFCLIYLPIILKSGTILAGDGYNMYYPTLTNFRSTLQEFFGSVADGSPSFRLMNFNWGFGTDNFTGMVNYLGLLPYYIIAVFLPVSCVPVLLTASVFLLDFLAGLSFLALCRHFKHHSPWNSLMALGYALSPAFTDNAMFNPQFLYMFIAFPLMVIGIDRVLQKTGWKLLAACVAWIGFTSFTFLIYTLPFLAVFALLRVWFLYRETFFSSLVKAFLRCLPVLICSVLLAGVMMLPTLYLLRNSVRGVGTHTQLAELLIPETARMSSFFSTNDSSACPIFYVIPGLLLCAIILRGHRELKSYLAAMAVLLALPLMDYALNGFQYSLIRWGFVPTLLFCYAASVGMDSLHELNRRQGAVFVCLLAGYWIAYSCLVFTTVYAGDLYAAFLYVLMFCSFIPPVRRLLSRLLRKGISAVRSFIRILKEKTPSPKHYLATAAFLFFCVLLICGIMLTVFMPNYAFYPQFIPLCGITGLCVCLLLRFKRLARIVPAALAVCYFGCSLLFFWPFRQSVFEPVAEPEDVLILRDAFHPGDTFGRSCDQDYFYLTAPETEEDAESSSKESEQESGSQDTQSASMIMNNTFYHPPVNALNADIITNISTNFGLIYQIPTVATFHNMIDSDMLTFLERCGQSPNPTGITGYSGFCGKEPLYSLFGVNCLTAYFELPEMFGLTQTAVDHLSDDSDFYRYQYDYALPVGVTYDQYMSSAEYDSLSGSVLPFAMMQYAETGTDSPASGNLLPEQYLCDCDIEKTYLKTLTSGVDVYDHKITLHTDTTDCFLYIEFTGANVQYPPGLDNKSIRFFTDGEEYMTSYLINNNGRWPWLRHPDRYSFTFGCMDHAVREISVAPSMNFDAVRIYAIPSSVLTDAYTARTQEMLENVSFTTNTLTGNITVSSDKLLSVALLHNDGWRVYVDGTEQPLEKVNRLFIGVKLTAGSHDVRFVYRTPWLTAGILCTAAGVLLWILLVFVMPKKQKQEPAAV